MEFWVDLQFISPYASTLTTPTLLPSRSLWLLQKSVFLSHLRRPCSPTHSFAFPLLALFHIFQFILSHLFFTCVSLPPPVSSPLLLCGSAQPSSTCTSSHELSTCFWQYFLPWKCAVMLKVMNCSRAVRRNGPIPIVPVCLDSTVHEFLDISSTTVVLWWLSCPVLLKQYA